MRDFVARAKDDRILLVIALICLLYFIISIRRGIRRGVSGEICSLVSILIATLCLVLILLIKRAMQNHTYGTVVVVGAALVVIAMGWKIIRLIASPLKGFKKIGVVNAIDSIFGAVAGVVEGAAVFWVVMKIYDLYLSTKG